MKLIDEYNFLTLTVIRATLSQVEEDVVRVLEESRDRLPEVEYRYWRAAFEPRAVYFPSPQLGAALPIVSALWEPSSSDGLVAFMANLSDGWIQLVRYCSRRLPSEFLAIRTSRSGEPSVRNDFVLVQRGKDARMVAAWTEDSEWRFHASGEPQPFEDLSNNKKRRIRDRLNREIIVEYAHRFGADISDDSFWTSRGDAFWFKNVVSP